MIEPFVAQFTDEKIPCTHLRQQVIQLSPEQDELIRSIKATPYAAGLLLGEEGPQAFTPSSSLMDWLGEHSTKVAVINKKAEWLFLCGRMILGESILSCSETSGIVLIKNQQGETLGYGKLFYENDKKLIRNMYDKGFFLRREKNKQAYRSDGSANKKTGLSRPTQRR